ncbi:inorganic phosphate transporter [Methanococcoides methylutens]|uniref:Sulfate permease, Pit-type n=1 Tax=Methanococcoides methylutens MM1 TaxID=1434104 RepID=A0A0E3WZZ2_METMT|nr:inorganic phosphate transporter [Methanococcoides methylutens]AKB84729.1 Sulfate permease, Pit-type [Methanococcoides methylutens MM1]
MIIALAAIASAIFMGINIGGNNAAAAMGPAYGARARTKKQAVILIAIFSLLGALISGEEVIRTLGEGIIPGNTITITAAIIATSAAAISLFIGNILKVPISASQSAVGAIVGIGIFYGILDTQLLSEIVGWWIATPILAFVLAYLSGKYIHPRMVVWLVEHESEAQIRSTIGKLLTVTGCYVAYSAGANNAANAVGPLVGAGFVDATTGAVIGGLTLGIGAIVIGGRVLQTVGTDIAEICTIRAIFIEVIVAIIVHVASHYGIPVALGQLVPAAVIGIGCANKGMATMKNRMVRRIVVMWVISPLVAGLMAYTAISLVS